jgi:hypothetical protein
MYVLVSANGNVVRINRIEERPDTVSSNNKPIMHLGFDTDEMIATFPTMEEALLAHAEGESDKYSYQHSMSVGVAKLVIRNVMIR